MNVHKNARLTPPVPLTFEPYSRDAPRADRG